MTNTKPTDSEGIAERRASAALSVPFVLMLEPKELANVLH